MIINNPNQQGGSNILMSLLQSLGGKQGAGIGSLAGLLDMFKGPNREQYEQITSDSPIDLLYSRDPMFPQRKNEWSHLPPGAL